ncbi:MAG TPA: SDR family oxidoreductase [Gemmatimonadales bacterium]|nr:SDR family oxidoreductase [Gemmatimonadales bacterium]
MPRPLAQQTVVITGASSGIGRCTAQHLAARGARVVLTARRAEALAGLARQIEVDGGKALPVPGDVTREADLRAVARAAVERFGAIDTWVNNAAVFIQGRVQDLTLDEYRRLFDVNLVGYINGTQCALEPMLRQGSGNIIQISSIVAKRGAAWFSAYAASKAALDGFSQTLRAELWGTDVHVSTLYLPQLDTPIYRHSRGKFGTVPKPPPPVTDPLIAARAIARLAEKPAAERFLGAFGYFYRGVAKLPARAGDWFLHHTAGFTLSDIPDRGDNLDRPMDDVPRVRDGWAERGWRGITLREIARVLPWESAVGAAALGLAAGAAAKRMAGRNGRARPPGRGPGPRPGRRALGTARRARGG